MNWREIVSALSSARLVKVTMPFAAVCVVVPCRGPEPLLSEAVTSVVLSPVSRLPYWSSMSMTGWVANAAPAVAVADGCVTSTNWAAAAGLTTMLFDVAAVRTRNAGELERNRLGLVVGQVGECGDAAGDRLRGGALQRATTRLSAAVTSVVLSPVSRLPYWSST